MDNYKKQAEDFLKSTGVQFKAEFVKFGKHFDGDTESRDIYKITLERGNYLNNHTRKFVFNFGQSIHCSGKYRVLCNTRRHKSGDMLHSKEELKQERGSFFGYGNCWKENKDFSEPSAYDVLTCLTKHEVSSFEDFCGDFGYDTDSRKAEKTYKAVLNEYQNVCMLWNGEEIAQLQEIQ